MRFLNKRTNRLPMEDFDTLSTFESPLDDEHLLLSEVICGDAELLYMDSYFRELFLTQKP